MVAGQVIVQYCKLIRLCSLMVVLGAMKKFYGSEAWARKMGRFNSVSKDNDVPLVIFFLKFNIVNNEIEVSEILRRFG